MYDPQIKFYVGRFTYSMLSGINFIYLFVYASGEMELNVTQLS